VAHMPRQGTSGRQIEWLVDCESDRMRRTCHRETVRTSQPDPPGFPIPRDPSVHDPDPAPLPPDPSPFPNYEGVPPVQPIAYRGR